MTNHTYGVVSERLGHIDASRTLQGAKNYATRHGYTSVSIRYNCGYNAAIVARKIKGKWEAV